MGPKAPNNEVTILDMTPAKQVQAPKPQTRKSPWCLGGNGGMDYRARD